jgi:DNA replication protein DnaC
MDQTHSQAHLTDNWISNVIQKYRESYKQELKKKKETRIYIHGDKFPFDSFCKLLEAAGSDALIKQNIRTKFVIDNGNKQVIEQLYFWLTMNENFTGNLNKGIAMVGPFGVGKTILFEAFCSLTNYLVEGLNFKRTKFFKTQYVFDTIAANNGVIPIDFTNTPAILDEMGRESLYSSSFGNQTAPIINLLQKRYDLGRLTHLTANFDLQGLTEKYGQMVTDRLKEMVNFIEFKGQSRRK